MYRIFFIIFCSFWGIIFFLIPQIPGSSHHAVSYIMGILSCIIAIILIRSEIKVSK